MCVVWMGELMCGCEVTENGEFVVGAGCKHCKECNTMPNVHPFGPGRLVNNQLK